LRDQVLEAVWRYAAVEGKVSGSTPKARKIRLCTKNDLLLGKRCKVVGIYRLDHSAKQRLTFSAFQTIIERLDAEPIVILIYDQLIVSRLLCYPIVLYVVLEAR
jgi:DNA replicative helicase MCM subunit Mcm2 (Cdc46/Mcm family)